MVQPKTKHLWRPSKLERRVASTARLTADREAARIPWPELQEAREKFVMTRALGKSPALLKGYLEEMEGQGICRRRHGDPYRGFGQIEVCDAFWPYEKDPARVQNEHETEYVERIRQRLSTHPCMRIAFTPADRRLALELCRKNVSLDDVERAILLGCSRKCTALLNGQIGGPITSLRYFQEIIEEVRQLQITADYWRYLELNLSRMEAELREKQAQVETK